jgi:hypothetical protein
MSPPPYPHTPPRTPRVRLRRLSKQPCNPCSALRAPCSASAPYHSRRSCPESSPYPKPSASILSTASTSATTLTALPFKSYPGLHALSNPPPHAPPHAPYHTAALAWQWGGTKLPCSAVLVLLVGCLLPGGGALSTSLAAPTTASPPPPLPPPRPHLSAPPPSPVACGRPGHCSEAAGLRDPDELHEARAYDYGQSPRASNGVRGSTGEWARGMERKPLAARGHTGTSSSAAMPDTPLLSCDAE